MRKWRDIEKDKERAWYDILDSYAENGPGEPELCPSCGAAHIRCFFQRHNEEGRAGSWIWCPACLQYAHFSGRAPSWWQNVSTGQLQHDPDWLEEHWDELEPLLKAAGDLK